MRRATRPSSTQAAQVLNHEAPACAKPATPSPVEIVPITRLFCSPTNPRNNDAAVPHVAASIRRFGWQQPIVARRTGEVIADNTRLKAAQELGMTEAPAWWFDGTDLDAVALSIADNQSHEFAQRDEPELAQLLQPATT